MDRLSFTGPVQKITGDYTYHFLIVPEDLVAQGGLRARDRIKVTFDNGRYIHCALQKDQAGSHIIYLGKYFREKAGVVPGQSVTATIEKDTSELGVEMPVEIDEVLSIDEDGLHAWEKLTPGKKRSAIYFVAKAKSEATRISRALMIIENIKNGFTKPQEFTRRQL